MKNMKLECKCHGVSGSCSIRTCWKAMQDFREVGMYLRSKYDDASEVTMGQDGTGLSTSRNHRRPNRVNLVYFEESPDYCKRDPETGWFPSLYHARHGARGYPHPYSNTLTHCLHNVYKYWYLLLKIIPESPTTQWTTQ